MNTNTRHMAVATALAVGLALSLAACGSEPAATTAQVTLRSSPPAEVWISGEMKGTTPIELTLAAGSHDVTFKAEGFADAADTIAVEGGKDLTVDAELRARTDADETLVLVARALGISRAPFESPEVHRGRGTAAVMLYWPQKDVRMEGLTSFRIDVTEDYEGDGFIEFHKGREILHREPFTPEQMATVKAIPESVREALETNATVTWGVYYENKRKKPVTAKFKVIRKRTADKQLAKLEQRKFFRRQPALVKELMRVDVLRNNRLYTEALVGSLAVLQRNPDSIQPYRGIVQAAQRLGLKDTPMFAAAMRHVSGRGGLGRKDLGIGAEGISETGAAQAGPPAREFAGPPTAQAERPAAGDPGPDVRVTPTEEIPRGEPLDPSPGLADGVDRPADTLADNLQRRLEEAEEQALRAEQAERAVGQADQDYAAAVQQMREREQAANDAAAAREALPDGDPAIPAADAEVERTRRALDEANGAVGEAERAREQVRSEALETLGQTGSAEEARQQVRQLRERLAEAEARATAGPTAGPRIDAGSLDPATREQAERLRVHHERVDEAWVRQNAARRQADAAARALAEAQGLPDTDPSRAEHIAEAQEAYDRAQAELGDASKGYERAQEALRDAQGTQAERDARALEEQMRAQLAEVIALQERLDELRADQQAASAASQAAREALAQAEGLPDTDPDRAAKIAAAQAAAESAVQAERDANAALQRKQEELDDAANALEGMKAEVEPGAGR